MKWGLRCRRTNNLLRFLFFVGEGGRDGANEYNYQTSVEEETLFENVYR
jgi:hypothetical protein